MGESRIETPRSLPRPAIWTASQSFIRGVVPALLHPLMRLTAVVLALGAGMRRLFFHFAAQIWAFHENVPLEDLTPWTRPIYGSDGIEPQVLLLLLVLLAAATIPAMVLLEKLPPRACAAVVALCFAVAFRFAIDVPPQLPEASIDPSVDHVFVTELGVLLLALVVRWAARRRLASIIWAVLLMPVCFVATGQLSYNDLSAVLAPALRLRLGFSPSEIYFQYDSLLSLLALGWHWLGGNPLQFPFCTQVSFYLFLSGCYVLATRLFENRALAALLLAAICVVRYYGIYLDPNAVPQVTPLRLDLWIVLLALALSLGLRHWSVGLALGLICFFCRGFGILYLGSYALALAAGFLLERATARQHVPFWRDLASWLWRTVPALLLVASGIVAATFVFGSSVGAAVMYHRFGVGMLRINQDSFYWWIAPLLAAAGWLVFSLRAVLPIQRAQAALFLLALAAGNLIYFFGRSHEHNLLNISASLLLCFFLGIDLAAMLLCEPSPVWMGKAVRAAPWLVLVLAAFFYSQRIYSKVDSQIAAGWAWRVPLSGEDTGPIRCDEIAAAAHQDRRIFIFGLYDYWFYETCGYVPQGYIQPIVLQPVKAIMVELLNQLLGQGYKIVLPKSRASMSFSEFSEQLPKLERTETPNYVIYSRTPENIPSAPPPIP